MARVAQTHIITTKMGHRPHTGIKKSHTIIKFPKSWFFFIVVEDVFILTWEFCYYGHGVKIFASHLKIYTLPKSTSFEL